MAIATACSISSFIMHAPVKTSPGPYVGENAQANLNDTLLKRDYVVAILCHGKVCNIYHAALTSTSTTLRCYQPLLRDGPDHA
jgi:hypothetical protein